MEKKYNFDLIFFQVNKLEMNHKTQRLLNTLSSVLIIYQDFAFLIIKNIPPPKKQKQKKQTMINADMYVLL